VTFRSGLSAAGILVFFAFTARPPNGSSVAATGGGAASSLAEGRGSPPAAPSPVPSPAKAAVGGATLLISSGLTAQAGAPNPLANHPYVLPRDSLSAIIVRSGV
jgi:hypothetical protein